jgi:two-component system, OmpR family, phosphate regulon sensor histidine kinase PhoR
VGVLGLPRKLRLAPLWPALAAVATAAALLWALLPGLFERAASVQLLDALRILSPIVTERAADPEADLAAWIHEIGAGSGLRLTLIASDGRVIADSAVPRAAVRDLDNHARRPEVREALASGQGLAVRGSDTTGRPYVYAARTLTDAEGRLFVLRLAEPLAHLRELRGRLAAAMALAALAAGLAILLTSLWIDRHLFHPLYRLIGASAELAEGRATRVEVPAEEELAALGRSLNRLAETAEARFAALRAERDHLQAILASMSEGVLVVDAAGRAALVNPAFRELFELTGETVVGLPVLEVVRQAEVARIVEETLRLGRPQAGQIETLIPERGPERRTVLLASAALAGGQRGAVLVARDTTELTRVADMRRDFVANVSHELKTPLAAIRGYAETLRDGALDEPDTARRFTGRILSQCRRLQALLDDLLTLSRLESVGLPAERETVDLGSVARRTVELFSAPARDRGVEIAAELQPAPPVRGETDALERMLLNLVDNAVKYNRPGGTVAVRVFPGPGSRDGEAVLEVEDTGIGIPPESLARIFERFYRVDKGRARDEGGTGLGLAIVKHVAQLHGGQVEVESRMGKGTTFRVRLPAG